MNDDEFSGLTNGTPTLMSVWGIDEALKSIEDFRAKFGDTFTKRVRMHSLDIAAFEAEMVRRGDRVSADAAAIIGGVMTIRGVEVVADDTRPRWRPKFE